MKKICARLGLNPEASEESIILEIDRIENKKKADMDDLDDKMKKLKDEMAGSKKAYDDKCAEYGAMEKEYKDLKKKADDEEMDKKKDKAKKVVDSAVKLGKIVNKAEIMQDWVDKFVADETGTTKLLEGLGVNMKAPDITNIENKIDLTGLSDEEKEVVEWEARTKEKFGSAAWINYCSMKKMNADQKKFKV